MRTNYKIKIFINKTKINKNQLNKLQHHLF